MTDAATGTGRQLVSFFQDAPKKPSNSVGIELLPIDQANRFVLPGPVVVGTVYVRHPIDNRELIAFADYDEKLAQDRYNEALRVFTKLGAARIVAASRRQTSKQVGGRLGLRRIGADLGAGRDATWSLTFDQEGVGGVPVDPRPLRFRDEPMLDAVCDGVLNLGVRKGRIQITRSSTLGVDGELGLRLKEGRFQAWGERHEGDGDRVRDRSSLHRRGREGPRRCRRQDRAARCRGPAIVPAANLARGGTPDQCVTSSWDGGVSASTIGRGPQDHVEAAEQRDVVRDGAV